jgi:hypothetical protein
MNKILFIVMMCCTSCFGQIVTDSILGNWYLTEGCIPKKVGAWATDPTSSAKFCFSKIKSTGNVAIGIPINKEIFIENVRWTFISDQKRNILVCEYIKEVVLSIARINNRITHLETKVFATYKNKYYWDYDEQSALLKIFKNKQLTSLLAGFKVDNKAALTFIKQ